MAYRVMCVRSVRGVGQASVSPPVEWAVVIVDPDVRVEVRLADDDDASDELGSLAHDAVRHAPSVREARDDDAAVVWQRVVGPHGRDERGDELDVVVAFVLPRKAVPAALEGFPALGPVVAGKGGRAGRRTSTPRPRCPPIRAGR